MNSEIDAARSPSKRVAHVAGLGEQRPGPVHVES